MPVNKNEVSKFVRVSIGNDASEEKKAEIKRKVGDLLVSEINSYLDQSRSPVTGESLEKKADGTQSRLFLTGDMRSQITYEETKAGIKVGIFDPDETPKAFNHNVGDTLPKRPFIPKGNEPFEEKIQKKVESIINEAKNSSSKKTIKEVLDALNNATFEFPDG